MSLRGKTAIVTGSTKGIGRAIVLRLASLGADVVVNYARDKGAADEVQSSPKGMGVRAVSVRADVSKVSEIDALFAEALGTFGKIDIVVANAGVEKVNIPLAETSEEDFDLLFRTNTKGPFFVLRAAARHVVDGGRILNISSSSTACPQPGLALYGGSKYAPNYLVKVLARELGHRRIAVNALLPGPIAGAGIFTGVRHDEPYMKSLRDSIPLGRMATPDDVADAVEFLVDDKALFVTGETILMNGGSSN